MRSVLIWVGAERKPKPCRDLPQPPGGLSWSGRFEESFATNHLLARSQGLYKATAFRLIPPSSSDAQLKIEAHPVYIDLGSVLP